MDYLFIILVKIFNMRKIILFVFILMGQQGYSQITIDYINAPSIEQCRTNDTFTTLKLKSLPSIEIGTIRYGILLLQLHSNVTF